MVNSGADGVASKKREDLALLNTRRFTVINSATLVKVSSTRLVA